MNRTHYKEFKKKLSKANELRQKYGDLWRQIHKDLLGYPDDENRRELLTMVRDIYESPLKEQMRRDNKILPNRYNRICPICDGVIPKGTSVYDRKGTGGLYSNDRLCAICKLPLTGRQRKYCSEVCKAVGRSRHWRKENPEKDRLAKSRYLNNSQGRERWGKRDATEMIFCADVEREIYRRDCYHSNRKPCKSCEHFLERGL